jgi:hypothetical protein
VVSAAPSSDLAFSRAVHAAIETVAAARRVVSPRSVIVVRIPRAVMVVRVRVDRRLRSSAAS